MIKKRKAYRVYDDNELCEKKGWDFIHSIWVTDNFECRNMDMRDAFKNSEYISGRIVDDSIKDSLIFTFFDSVQYGVNKNKIIEIPYETLLECCCEEIGIVYCAESNKTSG